MFQVPWAPPNIASSGPSTASAGSIIRWSSWTWSIQLNLGLPLLLALPVEQFSREPFFCHSFYMAQPPNYILYQACDYVWFFHWPDQIFSKDSGLYVPKSANSFHSTHLKITSLQCLNVPFVGTLISLKFKFSEDLNPFPQIVSPDADQKIHPGYCKGDVNN